MAEKFCLENFFNLNINLHGVLNYSENVYWGKWYLVQLAPLPSINPTLSHYKLLSIFAVNELSVTLGSYCPAFESC